MHWFVWVNLPPHLVEVCLLDKAPAFLWYSGALVIQNFLQVCRLDSSYRKILVEHYVDGKVPFTLRTEF